MNTEEEIRIPKKELKVCELADMLNYVVAYRDIDVVYMAMLLFYSDVEEAVQEAGYDKQKLRLKVARLRKQITEIRGLQ